MQANLVETPDELDGPLRVVHYHALGDFQRQVIRAAAGLIQHLFDVLQQVAMHELTPR